MYLIFLKINFCWVARAHHLTPKEEKKYVMTSHLLTSVQLSINLKFKIEHFAYVDEVIL